MKRTLFLGIMTLTCLMTQAQEILIGDMWYILHGDTQSASMELYDPEDPDVHVVIPDTVSYEGQDYAVTEIGAGAFVDCNWIMSIKLPCNLTSIGGQTFLGCSALCEISIPPSVVEIGRGAFGECKSLPVEEGLRYADVVMVEVVDKSITHCKVREGTRFLGGIDNCPNLTEIFLPASMETELEGIGENCPSLTAIQVEKSSPYLVSQDGVLYDKAMESLICFPQGKEASNVSIPESVKQICGWAFQRNNSLARVEIPSNVTTIGEQAFFNCEKLESVTLSPGITTVEEAAFQFCSSLHTVAIPESVTTIGYWAFQTSFETPMDVVNQSHTPQVIANSVFAIHGTLHVPAGCKDIYQAAEGWKLFNTIVDDADSMTDIRSVSNPSAPIYDLSGRRLSSKPRKGMYIQGGKKEVNK